MRDQPIAQVTTGIEIDLEYHVLPVLHLARMAISLEHMLRDIQTSRDLLPGLDESPKNLGCLTDYGQSVADHADGAILSVIDLIKAHAEGKRVGGAA